VSSSAELRRPPGNRRRVSGQAGPAQPPPPATGLVAGLASLGPYFAVETHHPSARIRRPWQPLSSLLGSPQALSTRITDVRGALAATAGRPRDQVEFRVAASVTQLGLAARLISPALGSAVLGFALPVDPARAWWVPALGGPFRLSLPETAIESSPSPAQLTDGDEVREQLLSLLRGPICSLVEMTAPMARSRRVLWGNVASAVNGAAAMLAMVRPALAAEAAATALAMLRFPALAGSYRGDPVDTFRRRSCCLIYRIASPPATEYCGDCILGERTTRLA
jgi:hypothetical protein